MIVLGIFALLFVAMVGGAAVRVAAIHLAADRGLRSRQLDLEERTIALSEQKAKGAPTPAAIPPDLYRRITAWGDLLAQESERKIILDLYAEVAPHYASESERWVQVRSLLPKPPADDAHEAMLS